MANEQQILQEIIDHINKRGGPFNGWYSGIASDPKDRLFKDHNVSEKKGHWIFQGAGSEQSARNIEDDLINIHGTDGGGGGGGPSTTFVYSYKKTPTTKP